ncbi:hypothetical protein L6164_012770 [Bauhinia variegata]|uniref:Uncharacterized protein n=1 Tax=Bauhinia variegata TaxID=167791 RepID=A0ACB9PAA6_BAUVA|nr:hypothetical protein L6164_012770 [Bauhinia variegata]
MQLSRQMSLHEIASSIIKTSDGSTAFHGRVEFASDTKQNTTVSVKMRFCFLFLISFLFLASISVSVSFARKEVDNASYDQCLQSCPRDQSYFNYLSCQTRCALVAGWGPEEEEPREPEENETEQQPESERPRGCEEEQQRPEPSEQPGGGTGRQEEGEQQQGEQQEQQQQQHPYHFPSHRFQTYYRTELGHIRALPRFDKFTRLLRGLENYRIIEFQSRPQTFFVPHHSNAHYLYIVLRGKAMFTIVNANNRESYNLGRADVLVIPAGSTVYAANRDNNQNLRVVVFAIPANNPEKFEFFYPGAQQNPQSYYNGFSRQTLEAAFNAPYQEIQRVLLGRGQQQQGQGLIVRTTWQQIKQLTQQARSSHGSQGQSQSGPFNLENYETSVSSDYGRMWEARPNQLPQLQNLGVSVACTELRPGALFLPHFNTEKTVVVYVVQGNGTFEMAFPHLSRHRSRGGSGCQCQEGQEQEEEWRVAQILSLSAEVNEGDVYVIPPGHPTALRASNNRKLHVVSFGINDENNQMNFLAGDRNNMIAQIDRPAKELTFSGSADQVEKLLRNQRQSYIVNGQPQQQQGQGSGGLRVPLSSILDAFN